MTKVFVHSKGNHVEGGVTVDIIVEEKGELSSLELEESSPSALQISPQTQQMLVPLVGEELSTTKGLSMYLLACCSPKTGLAKKGAQFLLVELLKSTCLRSTIITQATPQGPHLIMCVMNQEPSSSW
jgi:hypothetical protein